MRAPPLAAAAADRPASAGPGSGSGPLPGAVLFEPGPTGMWIIPAPPSGSEPPSATAVSKLPQTVGRMLRLKRTVVTEPLHSVSFGHFYPSRSAINSAPYSQTKTKPNIEISSLRSEVRSFLSDLK